MALYNKRTATNGVEIQILLVVPLSEHYRVARGRECYG